MRALVAAILILFSIQSFSATKSTKKKPKTNSVQQTQTVKASPTPTPAPAPAPVQQDLLKGVSTAPYQRFPLQSVLHQVPHKSVLIEADLLAQFGSYSIETPGAGNVTITDGYQQTIFGGTLEAEYGVLPNLSIGVSAGYQTSTDKNTDYKNTAGGIQPLWPDVTNSGVTDPSLLLDYRLVDSTLVVDLSGALRLGVISAARGQKGNNRTDPATQGNSGSGSYATSAGVRAGLQISDSLNAIAEISATYNFAGQVTNKLNPTDTLVNYDPYVSFTPGVEAEYFVTKEFVLNPFGRVVFNPKTSGTSNNGIVTTYEQAAAKTFNVGINGTYLITEGVALRAGYTYSSTESHILGIGVGSNPSTAANYKDQDAHILNLAALVEF